MKIEINIEKKHLFIILGAIILTAGIIIVAATPTAFSAAKGWHALQQVVKDATVNPPVSVDADNDGIIDNAEHATSAGNLNYVSGQKLCSAVLPGNWRDTVMVPSTWTKTTCADYKTQQAATNYQLGCIFDTGFSWGTIDGGIPLSNCGWS